MAYMNQGRQILDRIAEEAKEIANVEYLPKIEGRNMFMILAPKKTQ
jgi:translation initiation factor IF-3